MWDISALDALVLCMFFQLYFTNVSYQRLIPSAPSSAFNRYIDQCQELPDAPATLGEGKDLEVYAQAVQTAKRDSVDYWLEDVPKDFVTYVGWSSTQLTKGSSRRF